MLLHLQLTGFVLNVSVLNMMSLAGVELGDAGDDLACQARSMYA
jgi:hypothetical protein